MRIHTLLKKMTALALVLMFLVASSISRVEAAPAPDLIPEQTRQRSRTPSPD